MFASVLRWVYRLLGWIIVFQAIVIVSLLLYLTYGITYVRLFATDGTIYSCEVPFRQVDIRRNP